MPWGGATAGLDVRDWETHIFQTQGTDSLEAKHITDQRGEDVNHGTFFEQIDGVGDERIKAGIIARNVFDLIRTALVVIEIGEEIGPHRGPGAGGGFGGNRSSGFLTIHARLGSNLEYGKDIRILDAIIRFPIGVPVILHTRVIGLDGHMPPPCSCPTPEAPASIAASAAIDGL